MDNVDGRISRIAFRECITIDRCIKASVDLLSPSGASIFDNPRDSIL
jgi:hypothetical protein